jgi:acylphosphatase
MDRLEARVYGTVQGVGYRYFVVRHARRLGLTGFVRNLADGSVEVVAEGKAATLKELVSLLEAGPSGAAVERVEAGWEGHAKGYGSFDLKH